MTQQVNDIRPLSQDTRYAGVVFGGVDSIDEAIEQAKNAPDHGLAPQVVPRGTSRNRAAVLQHLNLLKEEPSKYSVEGMVARGWVQPEHDPEPVYGAPEIDPIQSAWAVHARIMALSNAQFDLYFRLKNVQKWPEMEALAMVEAYPYPAVQS
jgi:hypothetical protein